MLPNLATPSIFMTAAAIFSAASSAFIFLPSTTTMLPLALALLPLILLYCFTRSAMSFLLASSIDSPTSSLPGMSLRLVTVVLPPGPTDRTSYPIFFFGSSLILIFSFFSSATDDLGTQLGTTLPPFIFVPLCT